MDEDHPKMQRLDLTLEEPVANVAFDEALLEQAEASDTHPEVLRFWESPVPMVVLGRSSPFDTEVNHSYCQREGIPIARRCSGGQSVVAGPGCLMYALLLDYRRRPELRMLDTAHKFVMQSMVAALARVGMDVEIAGISDLVLGGRKVSGNSVRCKRNWMLYHGTMLCDLEIDLIARCLGDPARQPDYRTGRTHGQFLTQLDIRTDALKELIARQWRAAEEGCEVDPQLVQRLLREKYQTDDWTRKV